MSMVVDWLLLLNRKERYYLVKQATGGFSLDDAFRRTLSEAIEHEIPANTRIWMDYPFDWMYAAIQLADVYPHHKTVSAITFRSPDFRFPDAQHPVYVNANQEDIDLLVAFGDASGDHLVMIEAKGVTAFANRQFRSKVNRMRVIFDTAAPWYRPDVVPHFVLASPAPPTFLKTEPWFPEWVLKDGKPRWVPLHLESDLRRIERWDETTGQPAELAAAWHVRDTTAAALTS